MMTNDIKTIDNNEVVTTIDPLLSMIDRVCTDSSFDIDKMQKLIDMRNAEFDRQAKIAFNTDLANMQNELPRIIATHENKQTKSNYAKLEDINSAILPILKDFGFGVMFKVLSQDDSGVKIQATLTHKQGYNESTELFMPYDDKGIAGTKNKTLIHATGSTITYAKRYALCMLLDISTGDDIDGNTQDNSINEDQIKELEKLIEVSGIDKVKFITEYCKVDSLKQLHISNFDKAINALNKRIQVQNDNT